MRITANKNLFLLTLSSVICLASLSFGQPVETSQQPIDTTISAGTNPAPVHSLVALDHKYDNGGIIDLTWPASADDTAGSPSFSGYIVYRKQNAGFDSLSFVPTTLDSVYTYQDRNAPTDTTFVYAVAAVSELEMSALAESKPVHSTVEYFNLNAIYEVFLLLILSASIIGFIYTAKRGRILFLRKIAGLQAVEEAIGRATEMGRPILFVPGIHDMDDVQTIAGMTILSRVAKQTAEYDSRIFVPTRASLAMTAARETVREAYLTAGRPDAYKQDDIYYVTDEQFGYVAAVNGIMVRNKPATCFYLGAFFAESLILAETGNSIGAVQIAGTAMPAQLPFFVAACDYTLIGEELFAASAYLSGEPKQLGSLKGQDVGKAIAIAALIIGAILTTLAAQDGLNIESLASAHKVLTNIFSTGGGG